MKGVSRKFVVGACVVGAVAGVGLIARDAWPDGIQADDIRRGIEEFGPWGPVIYIAALSLNILTVMPPTPVMMISSGMLFGPVVGGIALWAGLQIGGAIAFFIARYIGQDYIERRLGDRAADFNDSLRTKGFRYLFVIRLIGMPPTELVNYASGLTKIPYRQFAVATAIGTIPTVFIIAFIGDQILTADFDNRWLLAAPLVLIPVLVIWRTRVSRRRSEREGSAD